MKILLAVDDSKYSQAALRRVLQKTHPEETKVRVPHVLEPILKTSAPVLSPCLCRNDGAAAPGC
jgi:hypothetical protein